MRRFYFSHIPSLDETFFVPKDQVNHLFRVLRIKQDDILEGVDGSGKTFQLLVLHADADLITLKVLSSNSSQEQALYSIAFIAELKNDAMDNSISLLAEHGIQSIIPFFAERSIPKFDQKSSLKKQDRRQKIAQEAIKKVGGVYSCTVDPSLSFKQIEHKLYSIPQKIIFWEDEHSPSLNLNNIDYSKIHAFIIGPEGGFSPKELSAFQSWGCQNYSLGSRILRAPQAAAAAATLIRYLTENQKSLY